MELTDIQIKNLISNILNEGYWGHLPLQNDSALDEFGEVAYKNIEEQLKNIDKNWSDKLSVFTYLGVIMYMLQIYNFFYSLKSLDKKFDFTNKINKAIKYIDDEKFINTWDDPEEVRKYIKKLPNMIKEILDKNSLGSDNFKKLKVTVPCNEGKNYVNMDVDVRNGGRSAVKMTEDEFKQEMIHAYHMYAMEQEAKYDYDMKQTPTPGNFVYKLAYKNRKNEDSKYTAKLYKDIWGGKYKFDSENVECRGGIKMSNKGFPYLLCYAGGDWECPVCFFIYFDGTHFRGYIPLKGNAINTKTKSAFDDGDDDVSFNEKACTEDFLARVEVKGTYKKRDFTKDEETFKEYRKKRIDDYNREKEEREKERQMKQEENNMEPDGGEINEMVKNILNKFVFEDGGGAPSANASGQFTVPFPGDDETLDRTPGFSIGKRVGKSNASKPVVSESKKHKVIKNDEGKVVPEFCKKCGGKVGTYICGEPIYKCSECGEYYGTVPFTLGRKKNIKESKQTWRDNPLFTIGKYKGIEKAKVIKENPDYCLWLHKKVMDKINNTPFSPKELALLDVSYYRKYKKFPIRSPHTPQYAKINGKYVSNMDKDELQYVWEHGNKEFKWLVKQEHMNRGWERRNWYELRGAPAFQSDDVGDDAWMRNHVYEKKENKGGDFFKKHGIKKQKIDSSHNVESIGFSEKEQKWYGWSHRAIYGFGIGSKMKKGYAGYKGKEWTAKTLDDAKQMAIDFANDVA